MKLQQNETKEQDAKKVQEIFEEYDLFDKSCIILKTFMKNVIQGCNL